MEKHRLSVENKLGFKKKIGILGRALFAGSLFLGVSTPRNAEAAGVGSYRVVTPDGTEKIFKVDRNPMYSVDENDKAARRVGRIVNIYRKILSTESKSIDDNIGSESTDGAKEDGNKVDGPEFIYNVENLSQDLEKTREMFWAWVGSSEEYGFEYFNDLVEAYESVVYSQIEKVETNDPSNPEIKRLRKKSDADLAFVRALGTIYANEFHNYGEDESQKFVPVLAEHRADIRQALFGPVMGEFEKSKNSREILEAMSLYNQMAGAIALHDSSFLERYIDLSEQDVERIANYGEYTLGVLSDISDFECAVSKIIRSKLETSFIEELSHFEQEGSYGKEFKELVVDLNWSEIAKSSALLGAALNVSEKEPYEMLALSIDSPAKVSVMRDLCGEAEFDRLQFFAPNFFNDLGSMRELFNGFSFGFNAKEKKQGFGGIFGETLKTPIEDVVYVKIFDYLVNTNVLTKDFVVSSGVYDKMLLWAELSAEQDSVQNEFEDIALKFKATQLDPISPPSRYR